MTLEVSCRVVVNSCSCRFGAYNNWMDRGMRDVKQN
jgi:hypothetical protein